MAPLSFGHYPRTMVERLGERLPDFTDEQSEMLKGSADFIGLNYYTATYVAATRCIDDSTYTNDPCAYLSSGKFVLCTHRQIVSYMDHLNK